MDQEFVLPDIYDISPETISETEAGLNPNLIPPDGARKDTDKNGEVYFRWPELLLIEKAQSTRTKSGLTEFFVQAKVRPTEGSGNVSKRVFSRYRVNFKVMRGEEENGGHRVMNRLSMTGLLSLLKSTGFLPNTVSTTGVPAALLLHLFPTYVPTEIDSIANNVTSELVEKIAVGNIVDRPNKGNPKYPRTVEVETWLPAPTQ